MVHLRAALANLDVEPVLRIEAGRLGLVVAAVFGLGFPVDAEADLVERRCGSACGHGDEKRHGHRDRDPRRGSAHPAP